MREITEHQVNPANDTLTIKVTDEPGAGGANHRYEILGFDATTNPSRHWLDLVYSDTVLFQNGPIAVAGVNGVTQEALLAIVADRLRSFQAGKYACDENASALRYVEMAMETLKNRTLARMARGAEGTYTV